MNNVYVITRKGRSDYETFNSHAIVAASESHARRIAENHKGQFDEDTWTDEAAFECLLVARESVVPPGIVLSYYNHG